MDLIGQLSVGIPHFKDHRFDSPYSVTQFLSDKNIWILIVSECLSVLAGHHNLSACEKVFPDDY